MYQERLGANTSLNQIAMNTITGRLKQLLSSTLKHLLNSTLSTLNDPRASYPYVFNVTKALFGLHFWNDYVFGVQATLGPSMLPTMNARGDWVCVSKFYRRGKGVRVGDLVSAKHPTFPGTGIMKRVLGMPGDFVLRDSPDSGSKMMVQVSNLERLR